MPKFEDLGVRAVVKDIGKFLGDIGRMNSAVKGAGQRMQRVGAGMASAGRSLTAGLTLPIIAIGGGALKMASDFETAFTEVTTLFDIPEAQVKSLREDVLALSKTMGIDPVEAAKAMYQAISAGVPAANVIGFLTENVKLAVGGVSDLETVVDLTTTVMNAWGKDTSELADVQDSLFLAVRQGKTTIAELGQAYFQVAPVAAAFKIDVDEVNAVLATLALNGTPTSEAMTQIRSAIVSLGAPTIRQRKRLDELGISFTEAEFAERGFIDIARELFLATGGNKEQLRKLLGSIEAVNAVLVIAGTGYETATKFLAEYDDKAGSATVAFEKMNETFGRQVTILKTELKVALIKLGAALIPVARSMLKALRVVLAVVNQMIDAFVALPKPLKIAIIAFFAFLAALGPILLIVGTLLTAMGAFVFLLPSIGVGLAAIGGILAAITIPALAFLGVTLLLVAVAPLVIDNWGPISQFFSKSLPEAFEDAFEAVKKIVTGVPKFLSGLAVSAIRIGADIINGISRGIAAATKGLFRVVAQVVAGMITILNPANWSFASTMTEAYGTAGADAGEGLTDEMLAAIKGGTPDVVDALEEPFEDVEGTAEEAGEDAGNAFLSALEDIVTRSMGAVSSALAAPLEAMRAVVQSLSGELQRLAGLPSVESAQEDLERAQLAVQEAALRPALRKAREARDRIGDIDDEIDALVEQREEIINLAQAHTAESDAIDKEIRALAKEKKGLEESAQETEDEADAIQKQIQALNDLAASREAERAVAVARAAIADQTLSTDKEILDALGRMEPVVREVTSAIDDQVSDLQTRFIPAWEDAAAAMSGAADGGAVGAPEVGDLGEIDFTAINTALEEALADINTPLNQMIEDIKSFFRKNAPVFAGIGLGILLAIIFGWNIGLAVAIGAAIGLLIVTFQDEILGAFSAIGSFITDNWAEIITMAAFATPFGPIVALATDAFGIRSALVNAFGFMLDEVTEKLGGLFDAIVSPFKAVKEFLIGDPLVGDLIAGIIAFFTFLPMQIVEALVSLVSMVAGPFIELAANLIGLITGLVSDIVNLFIGLPGAALAGILGAIEPLLGFFAGLPGILIGALGDIAGAFFSVGASIIGGLVSGLTSIDLGGVVSGIADEITGAVSDIASGAGGVVSDIGGAIGLQRGAFDVPGAGAGDKIPALLEPHEMVVPKMLANQIRSQVGSFQGLADLVSGRSGGTSALGAFMGTAGIRDQLDAMPARSSIAQTVAVNAPISVTIEARSWEEIRRVVHQEVDTALEDARQETARSGAELSGGIL